MNSPSPCVDPAGHETLVAVRPAGLRETADAHGVRFPACWRANFGRIFIRLALGVLSLWPCAAFVAYQNPSGQTLHWNLVNPDPEVPTSSVNRETRAVRYWLASDAFSATNTTAELNAVRAAFAQWQSVPGTVLKFEEAGLIAPKIDVNTEDGRNVFFWTKGSTLIAGGMDDIRGRLGVTYTRFFEDNTLAEADIVLNGVEFAWSTDYTRTNTSAFLVEATALHEIGHFFGLDHSPVGGATMMWRGAPGRSLQMGLAADDLSAVQALYGLATTTNHLAVLSGKVTLNGFGILGAAVFAEHQTAGVQAGTVSLPDGSYSLPALLPGAYHVHVAPLDPATAPDNTFLMRGREIAGEFINAETSFLATEPRPAILSAGPNRLDLAVASGSAPFRIAFLREASTRAALYQFAATPVAVLPGDRDLYIGLLSRDLPTSNASLFVTGSGLVLGPTRFETTVQGYRAVFAQLNVASNAPVGLRTIGLLSGSHRTYANGYLEVQSPVPDFNFDGLDDRFQRRYFPVFTAAEASPGADPDGDGFTNTREYSEDTNPVDPTSFKFRILSTRVTAQGTTLEFQSGPGKRYQVQRRKDVATSPWENLGNPITASADTSTFLDRHSTDPMTYYRVVAVP